MSVSIVGIDLGTTNSLVACVEKGVPRILTKGANARGMVPSVLSVQNGELIIGDQAKRLKITDPEHTAFSVKRLLGKGASDLKKVSEGLPFTVEAGSASGKNILEIKLGDRTMSPIEVSARILSKLREIASQSLDAPISQAVITVPAYFNDSQRQATRLAGKLAGLDVLRIINEPTAAALAFGFGQKKIDATIAVFDLGGGTFDLSILKLKDGVFEVLSTHGDTALGGDDLDRALVNDWLARNSIASVDRETLAKLLGRAEEIKFEVSRDSQSSDLKKKYELDGVGYSLAELHEVYRQVLSRLENPCRQAMSDAGLSNQDLTDVVVVGGPTRLSIVREKVREIFERYPNTSQDPDQAIAMGAAIMADIIAGNNRDMLLLDVVPLSLGIETYGDLLSVLIPRNTKIPTVSRETYTTHVDRQTSVDLHVFQGERDRASDNRSLARFKLPLEPLPAGVPRIEVSFMIDADGILQVSARDLRTGKLESVEVKPSFGLDENQIEKMLMESMDFAEKDIEYRKLADAKLEADKVILHTKKSLQNAAHLLSSGDKSKIMSALERVESLNRAKTTQSSELKAALFDLDGVTKGLAELMIKENLNAQS